MAFSTPILFLIFNRPEITARVFEAVRRHQPRKLYVAADGPRSNRPGEDVLCRQTRCVTEQIDWDCEVERLYRERNLGCGRAVSEAITWFFDQEKEGIILEDDCLPNDSFFAFCQILLERYREDDRIGTISGDFFFPPSLQHPHPYIFSKYVQIWGWATWRRVWQHYDFGLVGTDDEWMKIIGRHNPIDLEARYWGAVYRYLKRGIIDTWDYQVTLSCWKHDLVHIAPTRNLVENLGYGTDATHTNFASPNAGLRAQDFSSDLPMMPIQIDLLVDHGTFFYRFLESLHNTWILHEAIDVTEKLSWARWEARELAKKAILAGR